MQSALREDWVSMTDLAIGIAIMAGLSFLTFTLIQRHGHRCSTRILDVIAVLTVLGTIYYGFFVWDKVLLADLLPFSNLIIVGNWFPLTAGFLAGIAWNRVPGGSLRKIFSASLLLSVGMFSLVFPLLGAPPTCQDKWVDEVCLQTAPTTCSPAAAATLLKAYGVDTTEEEMAHLCLTRIGTNWQGLYHGLAVKGQLIQRRPELFECTLDELQKSEQLPVLLSVQLDLDDAGMNLYYESKAGWIPDVAHTVVLFGFDADGNAIIGEPSYGFERWSRKDMEILWHGRGIRLVESQ